MKLILDQFFMSGMKADVKDGYSEACISKIVSPIYRENINN